MFQINNILFYYFSRSSADDNQQEDADAATGKQNQVNVQAEEEGGESCDPDPADYHQDSLPLLSSGKAI